MCVLRRAVFCLCVCVLLVVYLLSRSSCLSVDAAVCLCSRPLGPNAQPPRSQAVRRKSAATGGVGGGRAACQRPLSSQWDATLEARKLERCTADEAGNIASAGLQ